MDKDLEMNVVPTYNDDPCTIIFSFSFNKGKTCIGKATISTSVQNIRFGKKSESLQSIAYCKEFEIAEEFRSTSLCKVISFLKMIGIERFNFLSDREICVN